MRRAANIDANQPEIVKVFRDLQCSVRHTHQLPDGGGDIIVGCQNLNCLVEIKDGSKPASKQKLTDDEKRFQQSWKGMYRVVSNTDEAIAVVAEMCAMAKAIGERGYAGVTGKGAKVHEQSGL